MPWIWPIIRDRGKIEKTQQQKEKTATSNKKEKKMAMLAINFPHAATATPFFSLSPFCRFLSFPRSSPPPPEYLKTSVLQCLGWAQGDLGRFRTCAHVAGSWADCSTRVAPSVSIEVDCPPLIWRFHVRLSPFVFPYFVFFLLPFVQFCLCVAFIYSIGLSCVMPCHYYIYNKDTRWA